MSRETVDQWMVAESGLPIRVSNGMRSAGILRIGELRAWTDADILRQRSLGRISLGHIHSFFNLCERIEKGQQAFESIRDVLDIFLDADEFSVIASRYGFERESLRVSRKCMTLQEIGSRDGKTRERIRQIEATARKKLSSRLGSVCLQPFHDYFHGILDSLGRSAPCAQIAPLTDRAVTAGFSPCAVLLLLCDLDPTRLTFHNQFFTTLPPAQLQGLEKQALVALSQRGEPTALAEVLGSLGGAAPALAPTVAQRTVTAILEHHPLVAATVDQRYFLYSRGMAAFLAEVMKQIPLPAHFRAITQAVNDRLLPGSRKGAGYVLDALNGHPLCVRSERGVYALRAEA
ncbi:MAG: hypothetical protein JXB04_12285 [Kiritimatiellae bacterium]|nr:hypothetical protein [Kiritimatiellia bacterium]